MVFLVLLSNIAKENQAESRSCQSVVNITISISGNALACFLKAVLQLMPLALLSLSILKKIIGRQDFGECSWGT